MKPQKIRDSINLEYLPRKPTSREQRQFRGEDLWAPASKTTGVELPKPVTV
jgi:hypothetical protein